MGTKAKDAIKKIAPAKVAKIAPAKVAKTAPAKVAKTAPAPAPAPRVGRPDDDAMNHGTVYGLTEQGKQDAEALSKGVIVGLKCKVQHGISVRWHIRAATISGIANGISEHAALTTHVNQTVARYLKENGRERQCKHANGEPVKWRIGEDAVTLMHGGLITVSKPTK